MKTFDMVRMLIKVFDVIEVCCSVGVDGGEGSSEAEKCGQSPCHESQGLNPIGGKKVQLEVSRCPNQDGIQGREPGRGV